MSAFLFFMTLTLCARGAAFGNPFEETVRILENRTAFHWGRDCLVWVVHYAEELVGPWVESEATRTGMTESERVVYREGFVAELKIGSAEPFLFTAYSFGPRPLSFAPLSEKIALVTASGERLKPLRYDARLDQPVAGIVQGLVFFPKQKNGDFAVAVKGMGVYDERIFAFGTSFSPPESSPAPDSPETEEDIPVVVVELPPASKNTAVPKAPVKPQREPELVLRRPPELPEKLEGVSVDVLPVEVPSEDAPPPPENAYVSREKTLRTFLGYWTEQRTGEMYAMLSGSSQKLFSKEAFAAELKKASDFRSALKEGYKIDWTGDERAKISAFRRLLVIRTVVSRTLGVAREGSAWKVVW